MQRSDATGQQLGGAQIFWDSLVREGVEVVFGYPGAQNLPLVDALVGVPLRFVLSRHEQGAAHMADGYARASGRVGVAIATSGPGATNLVTGVATAMRDSIPTVFVTGQVPAGQMGTDAFQEVDIIGITRPITKAGLLVRRADEIAPAVRRAFTLARSGRPGPVLVDICRDAQQQTAHLTWPAETDLQAAATDLDTAIADALALCAQARRPVILAGHGVVASETSLALVELAERLDAPVATTLLGLGAVPAQHALSLGMMGMHGTAAANRAIQAADLLVALGMRFDDRVTGRIDAFAPGARKIHVDIDPLELGRKIAVDVAISGDLRVVLGRLAAAAPRRRNANWRAQVRAWQCEAEGRDIVGGDADNNLLHGPHVIAALSRATAGRAIVTTDVGQHQMWAAQYYRCELPRHFISSGGMGTMGFGLPAAIGAKLARPDAEVWVVAGDGGFQMTQCELATLVQEKLDIKIAILNNGYLGMVRQWQELFYERRYTATPISSPDFVSLARAYGIEARRVPDRAQLGAAIAHARSTSGPIVTEFLVEPESIVYPMVPAGAALDDMLRRPLASARQEAAS
jgi:acetolactate synthase I/II/III large subunit